MELEAHIRVFFVCLIHVRCLFIYYTHEFLWNVFYVTAHYWTPSFVSWCTIQLELKLYTIFWVSHDIEMLNSPMPQWNFLPLLQNIDDFDDGGCEFLRNCSNFLLFLHAEIPSSKDVLKNKLVDLEHSSSPTSSRATVTACWVSPPNMSYVFLIRDFFKLYSNDLDSGVEFV
jgi:hypothetical protein